MANKIKIIADSTCDLSTEIKEKYDIEVHPFIVNLGDKSFRDGVDIKTNDIFNYYKSTGKLSKTAAASPAEYEELFKKWTEAGYDILFFTISSGFSAAYNNACIAAEGMNNVYVIESANLSTGILLEIMAAGDMIASGMGAQEIAAAIAEIVPKVRASFVIDTLEFLWKGGRCSGVAALGANLLKLKPCIEVVDGKMSVGKKYRGNIDKVVPQYIKDRLDASPRVVKRRAFITHTFDDMKVVNDAVNQVKATGKFDEVLVTKAGCTIYTHCGPNTLGVLFIDE
ncbi:MAG: DegV family protein [Firmicutes bacterium]|nr:DegV family protein [Bacillota bacterium]